MKYNDFVVEKAQVWDVDSGWSDPLSSFLRVREGRISAVGEAASAADPGVPRIALPDRFLVPGLIDAHVHLELDPAIRSPKDQLAVLEPERIRGMEARAVSMLAAGITTARDCGGGGHREHALRDAINDGQKTGPRLLCCGQPLTSVDGHCAFWGGEVSDRADIERVIATQVEHRSDWIKVMATGGVFTPGSRARDAQFDLAALRYLVETAGRADRFVAAHCHGTEGIGHAVRAGVRTIEHASFAGPDGFGTDLDEPLMEEMAAAELWVSPTVNGGWGRRIKNEKGELTNFFQRMSPTIRRQRAQGIDMIASTDAGIPGVAHNDLVSGLLAFEKFAAMKPAEVLKAATTEAAKALGVDDETGRLAAGLSADFLVLEEDPTANLSALVDPEVVVFKGDWLERGERASWPTTEEAR